MSVIKDFKLVLYLFLAIFQPPFLPINFIYILGLITFFLLSKEDVKTYKNYILLESKIKNIYRFFIGIFVYFLFINVIDIIFIDARDLTATRLRCFNQLMVLSYFQFLFIFYLFLQFEKRNYGLADAFRLLILAGLLQGGCAVIAFFVPPIRTAFMFFGDRALYDNDFFLERRGYGFSMTLIDTFGYGIGLIAGYMVLIGWPRRVKYRLLCIALLVFTTAINARTGLFVLVIAVFLKLIFWGGTFFKALFSIGVLSLLLYILKVFFPVILEMGVRSDNSTLVWICSDFLEMYYMVFESGASNSMQMEDATFLSNFVSLPDNFFEYLFGSGHYVYDTKHELGFRTDIGYYNLFWEFGILMSGVILLKFASFIGKPFLMTDNTKIKSIVVFNFVAYAFLLMKAILLGYNPGVFVNYYVTFVLYFYLKRDKRYSYV